MSGEEDEEACSSEERQAEITQFMEQTFVAGGRFTLVHSAAQTVIPGLDYIINRIAHPQVTLVSQIPGEVKSQMDERLCVPNR
jgi:hypothetical protein